MSLTLMEITADIQAMDALLDEMGGDISNDDIATYVDQLLQENTNNFNHKVDNYVKYISALLAKAAYRKQESARLLANSKTCENKATLLKDRLKYHLAELGIKKLSTGNYDLNIKKHGGKQKLDIYSDVPDEYMTEKIIEPVADTQKIREELESGRELDFAILMERGESLNIR